MFSELSELRILFLGNYADPKRLPSPDRPNSMSKARYHGEIRALLHKKCKSVIASSSPDVLFERRGEYDYVFSLLNRMRFRSSEVFVSAVCEYLRTPYLGANPEVRGVAEDKYLFKRLLAGSGIPAPRGMTFAIGDETDVQPEFKGPYFVKPRNGANSKYIEDSALCTDWKAARSEIDRLHSFGVHALVETFEPGFNITAPVLVENKPHILGLVESIVPTADAILTSPVKQQDGDDMGYKLHDNELLMESIKRDIETLYELCRPIDYFRADYRVDPATGARRMLEINVGCDISSFGSFAFAADAYGIPHPDLIERIIFASLKRQE